MSTAIDVYQNGTKVRVFGKFEDFDGNPGSPTAVIITVKKPDGTTLTPTVIDNTNPETGLAEVGTYYGEVTADDAGRWWARIAGTGAITAADEGWFQIKASEL